MTLAAWYWITLFLSVVWWAYWGYRTPATPQNYHYGPLGGGVLQFFLALLLGIAVFGSPFK